jgi:hypothetical protein
MGFAFADYDTVWKAMDGELGAYAHSSTGAGFALVGASGITTIPAPTLTVTSRTPDFRAA